MADENTAVDADEVETNGAEGAEELPATGEADAVPADTDEDSDE